MNDDTLILYYYNDGLSPRERRQVERAIRDDEAVGARYDDLRRQLAAMGDETAEPVPSHLLQHWHDSIDSAARRERTAQPPPARATNRFSFAWGAAVTAALAIGIGIGLYLADDRIAPSTPVTAAAGTEPDAGIAPAIFTRGVTAYFRDTQRELALLPVDGAAERVELIRQIIEQNRLFERAAEKNDAQSLARVLRAFEPILLQLATEDIAPGEAEALRKQLTFELGVMLTKLSRDTSNETHTT